MDNTKDGTSVKQNFTMVDSKPEWENKESDRRNEINIFDNIKTTKRLDEFRSRMESANKLLRKNKFKRRLKSLQKKVGVTYIQRILVRGVNGIQCFPEILRKYINIAYYKRTSIPVKKLEEGKQYQIVFFPPSYTPTIYSQFLGNKKNLYSLRSSQIIGKLYHIFGPDEFLFTSAVDPEKFSACVYTVDEEENIIEGECFPTKHYNYRFITYDYNKTWFCFEVDEKN